jgi:ketosteroid isomerase-like protein
MSQENVEIVRRGYEHWLATGEFLIAVLDPDFVWDMSTFRGWPEQQTYHDEGANQFIADWNDAWEDWVVEVEDHIDAGEAGVVTIAHQRGRSKASGVPVDMHFGQIWTVSDGKQARVRVYSTPEEALEAAGLSE